MKIGLSLSGGGAKGIAHIGVLQALQDHHVEIDLVAGTSAGAIIGAMFAAGVPMQDMIHAVRNASYVRMFGFKWPDRGFGDMNYLKSILAKTIKEDSFEALQKPLYVAVTNLNSGMIEIKSKGKLFDIIAASSSVPLLFKPIVIDGNHYLDGGIGMNLPVRCLVGKCDIIIGINLVNHQPMEDKYISSWSEVLSRTFDLSVYNNVKPELSLCDFVIEPVDIFKYNRFSLSQPEHLYKAGYEGAMQQMPALLNMIHSLEGNDEVED